MRFFVIAILLAIGLISPIGAIVIAQEANPTVQIAFLSKALAALQMQRNEANDRIVNLEARLALLSEENVVLHKRIVELTPKPEN